MGCSSGSIPCAARPANSARVCGSAKERDASPRADRMACRPNRATARGCRGHAGGPSTARSSLRPVVDDGTEQATVGARIRAQRHGRALHLVHHAGSRPAIERMCKHHRRDNPLDAVLRQRQRPEGGRDGCERLDGRADVVHEPRQRQLRRSHPAAGHRVRFHHEDLPAGLAPARSPQPGRSVRIRSRSHRASRPCAC